MEEIEFEIEKDKKFYWLKLDRRFFKQHEIVVIEGMPNGKDYILFYLKLLCESVSHEGNLRFSEEIPYDEAMLATITNTNIDIVRAAVQIFTKLHMMEILDDGTYFMSKVQGMIGSETDWAKKKREYRERQKELALIGQCTDNVLSLSDKSKEIRDKSSDTKKREFVSYDTHSQKESVSCPAENSAAYEGIKAHDIAPVFKEKFNNIDGIIKCERITVKREIAVSTILSNFSKDEINRVFEKVSNSTFLKGDNDKGWKATFDWLFDIDNFTSVLEGKFDYRKGNPKKEEKTEETDRSVWTDEDEEMKRRQEEFVAKWRAKRESDKQS